MLALEAIGAGVLSLGGWPGGSLAYHHQIGVVPEERDDRWELTSVPTCFKTTRSRRARRPALDERSRLEGQGDVLIASPDRDRMRA